MNFTIFSLYPQVSVSVQAEHQRLKFYAVKLYALNLMKLTVLGLQLELYYVMNLRVLSLRSQEKNENGGNSKSTRCANF